MMFKQMIIKIVKTKFKQVIIKKDTKLLINLFEDNSKTFKKLTSSDKNYIKDKASVLNKLINKNTICVKINGIIPKSLTYLGNR